ncbi:hypothetical protein SAY87_024950 [Trapa incisa]|uniref:MYND-type domain-containing protein n=1 Tax=Trapa incisa TaxID=236973 RepID=A0AAN7GLP0_9MYRT|nr:hypothetical protein SAY87_024950 [Trapa incisa]
MECAGKGRGTRCIGPARRRCGRCGAVSYCSASHQLSHWIVHKDECGRLEQQMKQVDVLNESPFTFSEEASVKICENQESRCSFLEKRGLHLAGMWECECSCEVTADSLEYQRIYDSWSLPSILCPCSEPVSPLSKCLLGWDDYYKWRNLPLNSPVAVLLHWAMTIYHAIKLAEIGGLIHKNKKELWIHVLGPEKELVQFGALAELQALLPGLQVHIVLVGPAVPQYRDGERINLSIYPRCNDGDCMCKSSSGSIMQTTSKSQTSEITLLFRRGLYHEVYKDIAKHSLPDLIIALNAGIAAYPTWLPTIELIKRVNIPAVFSDYCEEACNLAAQSISAVTGHTLSIPIQLNPFRQPLVVEESALLLPCYSNCFLFGI